MFWKTLPLPLMASCGVSSESASPFWVATCRQGGDMGMTDLVDVQGSHTRLVLNKRID